MPSFEETGTVNTPGSGSQPEPSAYPEDGAYCESTRRVALVSPFPASLRPLVEALTVRCFDVMVFHFENDPMLSALQADFLIIDRTKGAPGGPETELKAGRTIILLGAGGTVPDGSGYEALQWPCPVDTVLRKLEEWASPGRTGGISGAGQLRHKDIVMDLRRMTVTRSGARVELTKTEFDLLKVLLAGGGEVLSRQDIMQRLWGENYFGGSNSVDVHIKSLRQKLGDDPKRPKYIETVRGIGYRISDEISS